MESVLVTSLRTLVGFVVLLMLTRILGKKQISQMTFFTYITGIALGNIAGDMVVHRDITVLDGVTGMVLWAVLTLVVEFASLKSSKARVLLDGEPTIVIKEGRVLERAMASNRLNMDDLSMLLRNKDVFSVGEVDYAILEPNGELSVLKKVKPPQNRRRFLPTELIVDGQLVERNLAKLHRTREWLESKLRQEGVESLEDVFFVELQEDGSLYVDRREDLH
ncbi:DUF421 domain-containing protein [Tumebacillus sp. DT12]|uniref:DUF421 domain-containing protein n=1 Tax=Tumebacillus lacus TaxID=2995335 RepID=A0ABT3WXE2_9BACL|nr:DUF421 domain-containing protein [Tumebacillus lacus]